LVFLHPRRSTLLPYTTLFRSSGVWIWAVVQGLAQGGLFSLALTIVLLRSPDSHVASHMSSMSQSVGYIPAAMAPLGIGLLHQWTDRKSTRLNSSHVKSSYAVF